MASDMYGRINNLLSARPRTNIERSVPKIQRVQPHLRNREHNAKFYSPMLVSIGPIYRHKDYEKSLQQGEEYKLMWAKMYLEGISTCGPGPSSTEETSRQLAQHILTNMPELKGFYTEDAIEGHSDEDLAWIFFLDGCAVLYFMENVKDDSRPKLMIKVDQLMTVLQDLLLLENQLPFKLLRLLSKHNEHKLLAFVRNLFSVHHMASDVLNKDEGSTKNTGNCPASKPQNQINVPIDPNRIKRLDPGRITDSIPHLLHLLREVVIQLPTTRNRPGTSDQTSKTYRNIQELKASGIKVKANESKKSLIDINFKTVGHVAGRLYLSKLIMDDYTAPTLMNMIAYEMCPDFHNGYEISSYVAFLDSLIDQPDDVKELRKANVLHNMLGSDDEVANLFNSISTGLVPDTETYGAVRDDIEKHYKTKYKTWWFQFRSNHFDSPWSVAAFSAAIFALLLTVIQTYFQVWPRDDNKKNG